MDKPSKQMIKAIMNSKRESIKELREILPVESVYALVQQLGGCTINIPKMDSLVAAERNEMIREDYLSGSSYNELVKKYHLTTRYLRSIINSKDN